MDLSRKESEAYPKYFALSYENELQNLGKN